MASIVPTRPELDALLVRRDGDLREQPYRLLLLAIATREKSGVLTLRRGPLEKEIVFDAGAAVDCQSNIATETLGRFLVSSGRITEAQYHDALSSSASRGLSLEEWLTQRTILTPTDLNRAAQQNLGRKLLEPFHWTQGTWHFSQDLPAIDVAHRVRVPQLLITGIGKVEPFETIEAALQDAPQLHAGTSPLFESSELRLSEEQQQTLTKIRNGIALDELRRATSSPEDLDRFVYALLLLGIASTERAAPMFELELDHLPQPAAPAAPPPPAPAAVASTPALLPALSPNELTAAANACRQQDPFELLGVDATAGLMEIARAFMRTAERFLPSRYENGLREKAQDVFLASARAYAELADPSRRQAILDRRVQKPELKPVAPPPAPKPTPAPAPAPRPAKRAIIDPEELCREGRAAAAAGKLRDALGYFEMAADCDAQNGTYAAEVAWCRYQLLISPAAAAMKSLKNAIRIDPRCGVAYLYLGKIQETLGNKVEAEAYLGRASMLMQRPRF